MTKFYNTILAASIGAVAIVSVQTLPATALDATEIGEIAKGFTVMISGECQGSGAIVERQGENYTVLTANHVVATTGECFINTVDGMRYKLYEARPVPGTDVAVLNFQSNKNYAVAQTASSQNLRPGSILYFAGYPSPGQVDTKRSYTFYETRMTGRAQGSNEGYELSYTGFALPGMSGGPVLDSNARLVGIHGKADVRGVQGAVGNYGVPFEIFQAKERERTRENRAAAAERPTLQVEPPPTVAQQPPQPAVVAAPAPVPTPAPATTPAPAIAPPTTAFVPPAPEEPIAARGPETPAESAISAMVRGQQTHVTRNRNFINDVPLIAKTFNILLPQDYNFAIRKTTRGAFHYAIPKSPDMKAYVGAIFLQDNSTLSNPVTVSIVCEATIPQNIRPADPTFGRGKLACGTGTEQRSASNFPQQNLAVAPAPAPAATPAASTNAPQATVPQSNNFVSLVNVCNTFDRTGQSPHQERALEWLQGKISATTMQKFADEWRSQLVAKASNRPINLVDVCKVYDRAGMHPHQNRALEWLQQQIPRETLTDFGKKWQQQAIGGSR